MLVQKHGLNGSQSRTLGCLLEHKKLTIQDSERLCTSVNRRSLQCDIKGMLYEKIISEVGAGSADPTRYYVFMEL